MLFSECNQGCSCAAEQWDPMCSDSGVTYVSPCLAGCRSSTGRGKNIVGPQTFNRIEYMFDTASRGNRNEGITVSGVLLAVFPGHFPNRSLTTAAACTCPPQQTAAAQWGRASVLRPRSAAGVSPPTWLYLSSAPLSTLWGSHPDTWSSYGRQNNETRLASPLTADDKDTHK